MRKLQRYTFYLLITITMVLLLFPVYWMLVTSVKTPLEYTTQNPSLIPRHITFTHYLNLFQGDIFHYFLNSVIVALASTILSLVVGFMAAYSLTHYHFPAKLDLIFLVWVLLVRMAPPVVMAIPLYTTFRTFGLLNSLSGLIIAYQIYTLPYSIWMLLGFIRDVPLELEEAAAIDGATKLRTIASIVLPLVGPGLVATAIFGIIMTWNEFLYALLFLRTPSMFTLPIRIANFITEFGIDWGDLMAIGVAASFPILLLASFVQKRLLKGFAMQLK